MIFSASEQNKYEIQKIVNEALSNIQENIPVEVTKKNEDLTVDCKSLIDDRTFTNLQILTPIGYSFKLDRLRFGILLCVPYYFYSILSSGNILESIKSPQTQYGIFIPVLDNSNSQTFNKDNELTLSTSSNNASLSLNDNEIHLINQKGSIDIENDLLIKSKGNVSLQSQSLVEIKNNSANLKDLFTSIVECLNLAASSNSPQGPCTPNPMLPQKISEFQSKLQSLLK